jgi:hypothetical protein
LCLRGPDAPHAGVLARDSDDWTDADGGMLKAL